MNENKIITNDIDYKRIWDETKNILASEMTALTYDIYIKSMQPVGVRGDSLVLKSETAGVRTVVEQSHKEKINNAIKKVTPILKSFDVVIEDELEDELIFDDPKSREYQPPKKQSQNSSAFQERFTFDNFVVGPTNEFAVAASRAVAETPGSQYNPLFIYGGSGLGKTHLLQAIGNQLVETKPELTVVYITIEEFTNEFIETVSKNELDMNTGFRNKYRNADVLIVDDIQSIIGKPRVQEEFFHTFNALISQNKQIVLSSDRPPKEITPLEDRLRTRFEWGLMTDIGIPEIETRIAILKKKAFADRQDIDDDVLEYIASAMTTSIRELEGCYQKCGFKAKIKGSPKITLDIAKECLGSFITVSKVSYDSDKILEKVCKYFDVSKNQLLGKDRKKELSYPRQICMYLLDDMLEMPYTSIGKIFNKDHATVIYCKNKIEKLLKTDKLLQTQIKDIKDLCTLR